MGDEGEKRGAGMCHTNQANPQMSFFYCAGIHCTYSMIEVQLRAELQFYQFTNFQKMENVRVMQSCITYDIFYDARTMMADR